MISYKFVPMGVQAQIENDHIVFSNYSDLHHYPVGSTFVCDVGSLLQDGIIDHHTIKKENECATSLVFNEPDKYVQNIKDNKLTDYTIITHSDPDFDAVGCTYVVTKILLNIPISKYFKQISDYILDVDLGRIQLSEDNLISPFSLILAINHIINHEYFKKINESKKEQKILLLEEKNKEIINKSYILIDYILDQLENNKNIYNKDLFDSLKGFDNEIQLLKDDSSKYINDFSRSNKYLIPIPNKVTGEPEEVDFITTEYPESVLWKYWVRGDRQNSKTGSGFILTCAFLNSFKGRDKFRAIIAIDRTTDFYLKGLGMALEEAEIKKLLNKSNCNDLNLSIDDVLSASPAQRRKRFHRNDPWYDERDEFTILDAPREGSVLTNSEILDLILSVDYWVMLSKTLTDEKGEFYDDIRVLFPDIYVKTDDNFFNDDEKNEIIQIDKLVKLLQEGKLYSKKNVFKIILNNLSSFIPYNNNIGLKQLELLLIKISKIPKQNKQLIEEIEIIKGDILHLIIKILHKSGINNNSEIQAEVFIIQKKFFNPTIIRKEFGKFHVSNYEEFAKLFYFVCENCSKMIFYRCCSNLLNQNNDIEIFITISKIIKVNRHLTKIDLLELNSRIDLLDLMIEIQKHLKGKEFSIYSESLSSFDDYKDTIDDLLMFSDIDQTFRTKIRSLISKDSNYFLKLDANRTDYSAFCEEYKFLKNQILLNNNFWNAFIEVKSTIEVEFQRNSEFNVLRKYTKSFIEDCKLSQIIELKQIIEKGNIVGSKTITKSFLSMLNKLIVLKSFDNLLNRIQIVIIFNQLSKLLTDNYRQPDRNLVTENILDVSEHLLFIDIINNSIRHLIKAQFLPDIVEYQEEMQNILNQFSIALSKRSLDGYGSEEMKVFQELKLVFEMISSKNNIPIKNYNKRIDVISKIIARIGFENEGLLGMVNNVLSDPEKTGFKEILFNLKKQHEYEFHFLLQKIKANIEAETPVSMDNLKYILSGIVNEATKDKLRRIKQFIDSHADDNLHCDFYYFIVRKYRDLSFSMRQDNFVSPIHLPKVTKNGNQEEFLKYNREIRKYFIAEEGQYNLELIKKKIIKLKNRSHSENIQPNNLNENIIINQMSPNDVTRLSESVNIEVYEFLVNYFLDKYHLDEARKKIEDYSTTGAGVFIKLINSWWIPIITLLLVVLTFISPSKNENNIFSQITSIALTVLIFFPVTLLFAIVFKFINDYFQTLRNKKSFSANQNSKKPVKNIITKISSYGSKKISKLSKNLLFIDFLIPLILGIFVVTQGDNMLKQILNLSGYRLIALLPLLFTLSYYSLFSNISEKNSSFSFIDISKITTKIYLFLFSQTWIITTILLNIIGGKEQNGITLNFHWIDNIDLNIFPSGAITITLISLFIGLFVEGIISKTNKNENLKSD